MHRILLLIFLCFSTLTYAQTTVVTGRCVDKRGEVIEDVMISAKNAKTKFTWTDDKGRFEMTFVNQFGTTIFFKLDTNDRLEMELDFNRRDSINIGDFKFPYQVQKEFM